MLDVICLGILVADVIAKPVKGLPGVGKLELVEQLEMYAGGCAANTGIDLAKIGIQTGIIGKIGNDGFGKFMDEELNKYGVNVDGLRREEGVRTSASMVLVNNQGERSFIHCLGANAEFCDEDVDFNVIKKAKVLFIAGALLMPRFDGEPTKRVLKKAQAEGIYTVLDTAWDSTGKWMDLIGPCLPYLDLFIPSIEEASMLSGTDNVEEMADLFLSKGVKLVVIKLGTKGCFIKSNQGKKFTIPTYTYIKAVDTTGAGDSFVAGFLTGIIKGWNLHQCGKFANAVGTHCVMSVGANSGIKGINDILKFMEENEELWSENYEQ